MKAMEGSAREHEEFRLELERDKVVALSSIEASKLIAQAQATVLGAAFSSANIQIVGGDGQFMDKFLNAASVGKTLDGLVNTSGTLQKTLAPYLEGDANLLTDVTDTLGKAAPDGQAFKNVAISALLARLMSDADGPTRAKLQTLINQAKDLGLGDDSGTPSGE